MAASACAVHTLDNPKLRDCEAVFFACVLTSAVGMNNCSAHIPMAFAGILERLDTQFRVHIICHCKSQNGHIKTIKYCRHIELSIFCRNFRDVCDTLFARLFCGKIPLQQIVGFSRFPICFGDTVRFPALLVCRANALHYAVKRAFARYIFIRVFQSQCRVQSSSPISIVTLIFREYVLD